jgi:hypothetical protein
LQESNTMRGRWAAWFVAAVLAAASGCHSSAHRVESELHAREVEAQELREQLDGYKAHNQALEIELRALRGDPWALGPGPGPVVPPALVPPAYPIRSLTLGRQTGGYPSEHGYGDEALQVFAEPRDAEGHTVKVPGSALLVQAIEITPEGLKRPLSTWDIPPDELRNTWRSGLLSTGYSLTLPWKVWPSTDKLRVVAQLRLPDGRVYEADKDVIIHPAPGAHRPAPAPAPSGAPVLPPPTPVPPGDKAPGPVLPPPGMSDRRDPQAIWHASQPAPAAEILRPALLERDR